MASSWIHSKVKAAWSDPTESAKETVVGEKVWMEAAISLTKMRSITEAHWSSRPCQVMVPGGLMSSSPSSAIHCSKCAAQGEGVTSVGDHILE